MEPDLSNGLQIPADRHASVRHFGPMFAYSHLHGDRADVSSRFAGLAQYLVETLSDSPELAAGLRKLLEAKDCAVRALVA